MNVKINIILLLVIMVAQFRCAPDECHLEMCRVEGHFRTLVVTVIGNGSENDKVQLVRYYDHDNYETDKSKLRIYNPVSSKCKSKICTWKFQLYDLFVGGDEAGTGIKNIELEFYKNDKIMAESKIYPVEWKSERCISEIYDSMVEILDDYEYAEITIDF